MGPGAAVPAPLAAGRAAAAPCGLLPGGGRRRRREDGEAAEAEDTPGGSGGGAALGRRSLPASVQGARARPEEEEEAEEEAERPLQEERRVAPAPGGTSWDWPLSRPEKKSLAALLDRRVLLADNRLLEMELGALRRGRCGWAC